MSSLKCRHCLLILEQGQKQHWWVVIDTADVNLSKRRTSLDVGASRCRNPHLLKDKTQKENQMLRL